MATQKGVTITYYFPTNGELSALIEKAVKAGFKNHEMGAAGGVSSSRVSLIKNELSVAKPDENKMSRVYAILWAGLSELV